MKDPQSEKIIDTLLLYREHAVKIFKESYPEIVEPYKEVLMQHAQANNVGILEALYEVLKPKGRYDIPLSQTEKTLYSAAAVDILNAPQSRVIN